MDADARTMNSNGTRMRIVNFELMKISINIDKFLKIIDQKIISYSVLFQLFMAITSNSTAINSRNFQI